MKEFKKYVVIAGNYGSGKTELSLNLVRRARRQGKRAVLVDMDIVNPYFRSSEHEAALVEEGIRVVKPCYANTSVDVPSLPAEIYAPFDEPIDFAVFDAGGDPVGAAALGLLKEKIDAVRDDFEFLYVVNPARPLQGTAAEVAEMLRLIEGNSRQRVTGLVNNTNLARETTAALVAQGQTLVDEVSAQTGIPLRFVSVMRELESEARTLLPGLCILPIEISMRPAWLDETT